MELIRALSVSLVLSPKFGILVACVIRQFVEDSTHRTACSRPVVRVAPSLSLTRAEWLVFLPQSCLVIV